MLTVTAANGTTTKGYTLKITRARDVPSAPQRLSISSPQSGRLTVKWRAPANEGGSGISRYQVRVESGNWMDAPGGYDSEGNANAALDSTVAREYRITDGLIDGRATKIQVRAVASPRGDNPSPADTASVGPPASITGTSWPHIAAVVAADDDDSTFEDQNINEGDTVTIRVSLNTRTFFGATRVSLSVADTTKARILDSSNTIFEPGDSAQDFKVVAKDKLVDHATNNQTVAVTAKVEEEEANGRTVNTERDEETLTITDDDVKPTQAPDGLTLTAGASGVLNVAWTHLTSTGNTPQWGNAKADTREYQVGYKLSDAADTAWTKWTDGKVAATDNTTTLSGLTAGSQYTVEVRAVTAAGEGAAASKPSKRRQLATTSPNPIGSFDGRRKRPPPGSPGGGLLLFVG